MGSLNRNRYRTLLEQVVGQNVAAQGDSKSVKKYAAALEKLSGNKPAMKTGEDLKRLLAGKGGI